MDQRGQQQKANYHAWTINDEKSMDWLIAERIGLITTNEPELLLKKVRN
jgi:hypothetical protein